MCLIQDAGYITVEDASENVYALVVLLFFVNLISVALVQRSTQNMFHVSSKVRSSLQVGSGCIYLLFTHSLLLFLLSNLSVVILRFWIKGKLHDW